MKENAAMTNSVARMSPAMTKRLEVGVEQDAPFALAACRER